MSVQRNHSIGLQQIFRRVRKIAKSDYSLRHVCPSVRPCVCASVRMEQLNSHCTAFYKILYVSIFLKICQENSISLQPDKNNGHFTRRPI